MQFIFIFLVIKKGILTLADPWISLEARWLPMECSPFSGACKLEDLTQVLLTSTRCMLNKIHILKNLDFSFWKIWISASVQSTGLCFYIVESSGTEWWHHQALLTLGTTSLIYMSFQVTIGFWVQALCVTLRLDLISLTKANTTEGNSVCRTQGSDSNFGASELQ